MTNFKIGDRIVYLGTKEGETGTEWNSYFGKYGIKRGSLGTIKEVRESNGGFFIREDGRPHSSGKLFAGDIELAKGRKAKVVPVVKHVVIEDSCNNQHGTFNSYKEAEEKARSLSGNMTIYRLVEVSKITSTRKVTKVRVKRK